MRKALWLVTLACIGASAFAQWEVPTSVVLDGADPADRQVLGLAPPEWPDAAVSLVAARHRLVVTGEALGTTDLSVDLEPAPAAYGLGMYMTIVPTMANTGPVTLDVNGLGALPIVKGQALPLDSGDLRPGVPAQLVHNGEVFQLLNSTYINCPDGYVASSPRTCVETASRDSVNFFAAAEFCRAQGARLCGLSEWIHACRSMPTFLGTVTGGEWVDSAANEQSGAKYMGTGVPGGPSGGHTGTIGCEFGYFVVPTANRRYRCCISR